MKKRMLACLGLVGLLVVLGWAEQAVPVAVSPGRAKGVAVVGELCPTFSWTSADWAIGYRIEVFEALGVAPVSYEQMASSGAAAVLTKEIEGRGLSWTPSTEEGLPGGGMYVWYVEAMSLAGPGVWSSGRVFIVSAAVGDAATEERVTKVLRENGVRDEVITSVVREMKTGETGAIPGGVGSKTLDAVRPMGSEGTNNTLYGLGAGFSLTSGVYNTFVGRLAGYTNTNGSSNIFIGHEAGYSNTSGGDNTIIGTAAGYTNTTGYANTFLGREAGLSNTTGYESVFLGYRAGYSNTEAHNNLFLGCKTGYSNTTGDFNTFIGSNTGYYNTTGTSNTFIGFATGQDNVNGYSNVFVGTNSGMCNQDGFRNTFLGDHAGYDNHGGDNNTLVGFECGYGNWSGSNNAMLGFRSGYSATGSGNTFLGYSAGYNETGSNKLYIANSDTASPLIYGDFSSGILAVNGLLGVGTKSPTYPMELKTTGRNATFVLQRSDGGALNFINATSSYGQFGTGNNYPVRIQVNNAWKMQLNADGSLALANGAGCTSGGHWYDSPVSSRELKDNIEELKGAEALAAFEGLVPVKFSYKEEPGERHVGFIAEDVPELVATANRKAVGAMDVVAVLAQVVKEQQKMISDQQKTIADLKERMAKIENKGNPERQD